MRVDDLLLKKYPEMRREDERMKEVILDDIPVLIGKRGEIICIPNKEEIPSPIACVGKKGTGKSIILHRLTDESFWNWGINVANMNDSLDEGYSWSEKQNNRKWIGQLEQIRERPLALPIVYIFPNNKDLNLREEKKTGKMYIKGKEVNYIKISIPFSEFLDKIEGYMKLDKSGVYLRNIMPSLKGCETTEAVFETIESKIDVGKYTKAVWNKLKANLNNVFKDEILHITNPYCPEYLKCKGYEGNPFVALMNLGVVPCFITSNLYAQKYKNQVYAYHINDIFEAQDDIFENQKTYLVFDELTKVCSTDEKKKNPAEDALNRVATTGRQKNIGLIYATQNYSKIPHYIKTNTEYLFALRHSSKAEVNEIKKDFDLPELDENKLLKLKKLECVAITTEFFRVYYPDGSVEETDKPIKGKVIPPMSRHKMPSK